MHEGWQTLSKAEFKFQLCVEEAGDISKISETAGGGRIRERTTLKY